MAATQTTLVMKKGTVFPLPEDEKQKTKWIKVLNRKDSTELKNIFICYKYFAKYVNVKTPTRIKLKSTLKAVPTIVPDSQKVINLPPAATFETLKTSRKPPKPRVLREDELDYFKNKDCISNLEDVISKSSTNVGKDKIFQRKDECILIYKLESNLEQVPQVTSCIRVDNLLRVKLFYKNSPIVLPAWFRQGQNSVLTSCSMLQGFINHMKQVAEDRDSILSDMEALKLQQAPTYPARVIRFAIRKRYTSLQAYNLLLEEMPMPSVSYLRRLTSGEFCNCRINIFPL